MTPADLSSAVSPSGLPSALAASTEMRLKLESARRELRGLVRPAGAPHHQRRDIAPGDLDGAVGVGLERDRLGTAYTFISPKDEEQFAPSGENQLSEKTGEGHPACGLAAGWSPRCPRCPR